MTHRPPQIGSVPEDGHESVGVVAVGDHGEAVRGDDGVEGVVGVAGHGGGGCGAVGCHFRLSLFSFSLFLSLFSGGGGVWGSVLIDQSIDGLKCDG